MKLFLIIFLISGYAAAQDQLIGAWCTITPPAEISSDTTDLILFEFSSSSDSTRLMDLSNYSIEDMYGVNTDLLSIHWITTIDGISVDYTRLIGIVVPELKYKLVYRFGYINQEDYYFNNKYLPNLESTPTLIIKGEL